jgi:hypothetical protein
MPDRTAQLAAIKELQPAGHAIWYDAGVDAIIFGRAPLYVIFTSTELDRDDYLDLARVSYGRLLEATDQYMAAIVPMGSA